MKFFILVAVLIAGSCANLTADEASQVKTTWGQVKGKDAEILYAIFKENPDIKARFPDFVDKELDSLKGEADFTEHANKIV